MNELVTIIVPVYNGDTYVNACLSSAICQTYSNLEVIAVNDGSTDTTLGELQRMAALDSRITIIDQPNGGVTLARMAAVCKARGKWICFLDADDTLPPGAIEQYATMFGTQADIIVSGFMPGPGSRVAKATYLSRLLRLSAIRPELWGKCFKAQFIKQHMPSLDRRIAMGEDLLQNLVMGINANLIVAIPELQYNINLDNRNSVTKTFKRTEQYQTEFFYLLDTMCLSQCKSMPDYPQIEQSAYWSKLNGMKQILLDGNRFNPASPLWTSIQKYYTSPAAGGMQGAAEGMQAAAEGMQAAAAYNELGPSEKLLLKMSNHQVLYRLIMSLRLILILPSTIGKEMALSLRFSP